jgi:predicted SnoaL-like aldol condensation-catalyzing enzyme
MSQAADVHSRLLKLYPEVLAGRLDEALELIDPDVVDHRGGTQGTHRGIDAWRQKWAGVAGNDVTVTVEQNVSQGDISVNRYTIAGPGYAVTGIDMIRVRDGRLVEHWAVLDTTAIQHQTKVSSPPTTRT